MLLAFLSWATIAGGTTTATTTTTTTTTAACGGVSRSLDDPQCASCLSGVNATSGFTHSVAEWSSLDAHAIRA
jgi:hypothetical protein